MIKRRYVRKQGAAPAAVPGSRIRRAPVAPPPVPKTQSAYPSEREIWTVVIGVILFAAAIAIITVQFSAITGN